MSKDEQSGKADEPEDTGKVVKIEITDEEEGLESATEEEELPDGAELAEEYLSQLKYLQAEFENYKKIVARERIDYERRANERLIKDLLPIIDSFENAISSAKNNKDLKGLIEGVELIYNDFMDVLGERGLSSIEAVGKKFDPYKHEAMMVIKDSDLAEDTVVEELQKGYILDGNVIRTSKVKVSK